MYTYERTTEAYLYYKLINEPKGSGELKCHHHAYGNFVWEFQLRYNNGTNHIGGQRWLRAVSPEHTVDEGSQ